MGNSFNRMDDRGDDGASLAPPVQKVKTMKTEMNPSIDSNLEKEALFDAALVQVTPELLALPQEALQPVPLGVRDVVQMIKGILPRLQTFREAMLTVPGFDPALFDKLELYTDALYAADTRVLTASEPVNDLDASLAKAVTIRQTLLSDAKALEQRGLVNSKRLDELNGGVGYQNLASDLSLLASVLNESWAAIQGKTAIQHEELEEADRLGKYILRLLGQRDRNEAQTADATNLRQRAFARFARAYDNTRRAISLLRWETKDADKVAPSIYVVRATPQHKKPDEPPVNPVPPPVVTPPHANDPTATASAAAPSAAAATTPGAIDAPNSEPFMK